MATPTTREAHVRFYDEYNAVLDMAAEYYLDTIREVFQSSGWPTALGHPGRAGAAAGHQDLGPLTIEGELDDISGAGQTAAAHDLCSGIPDAHKRHITAEKCGHYGIFSAAAGDNIYPELRDFIRQYR